MGQQIDDNHGQITQHGDIHVQAMLCPGQQACPFPRQSESKRQADFYRDTGIWAPAAARDTLEDLMDAHGFTAPKLKAAWQANSLQWDTETQQLVTKTIWIEPIFGYFVAIIMVLYLLFECVAMVMNPPRGSWASLVQFVSVGSLYAVVLYLAARFLVLPYSIAKRVERIIHPTKSQNRFGWRFWGLG